MNIPKPYPGYWSKLQFGKEVEKLPLPAAGNDTLLEYELVIDERERVSIPDSLQKEIDSSSEKRIKVSKKLINPHPFVSVAQEKLSKKSTTNHGLLWTKYSDIIDVRVTEGTVNRALRIMDAILKEGEQRGWKIKEPSYNNTGFTIDGIEVEFLLREKLKTEKVPSTWRSGEFERKYIATGVLSLEIHCWSEDNIQKNFRDKRNTKIEDQLNNFFENLVKLAYLRRMEHIEYEKKQNIKAKKREMLQNKISRIEAEEKRITAFKDMALKWDECESMRRFIKAVENKYIDRPEARFEGKTIADWVPWANAIVDWIDPLREGKHLEIEEKVYFINQLKKISNLW